jgi:exosome complex component RRP4
MFRIQSLALDSSAPARPAKKARLWDDDDDDRQAAVAIPGDAIADANDWMRGHGTFLAAAPGEPDSEARDVLASVAGVVQRLNRLVTVQALRSRYRPEVGDLIVARIAEVR